MTVKLRPYLYDDFEAYKAVLVATDLFVEGYDSKENFGRQVEHDPRSIMVAVVNGEVVGGVIVLYQPWISLVYHLCVLPEFQGQGIGDRLLKRVESILRDRGTYEVGCYVKVGEEKLIELYTRMGFTADDPAIPMGRPLDLRSG